MSNIFQLLNIEPTNNYEAVKAAYWCQFKKLQDEIEQNSSSYDLIVKQIDELSKAYLAINTAEKFALFSQHFKTNIFVNIPYEYGEGKKGRNFDCDLLGLNKLDSDDKCAFRAKFDYQSLAGYITTRSAVNTFQVGRTDSESVDIENLHGHRYYVLIAEVEIPLSALSSTRRLNGKDKHSNFYWLNLGTSIGVEQIISIRPMRGPEYQNTCRMFALGRTNPNLLWLNTVLKLQNNQHEKTALDQENENGHQLF